MKRTPLYSSHVELGARIVDFAGFEMPVQYAGVVAEHKEVRSGVGAFDVSHMGEFRVTGRGAEEFLNHVITNNLTKCEDGQAQYTVMCYEDGGIVDDLITYRVSETEYLVVVNASNIDKDFEWMAQHKGNFEVEFVNISDQMSLIAVQGPKTEETIAKLSPDANIGDVKRFRFTYGSFSAGTAQATATIARTGYTGEDGVEIMVPNDHAPAIWRSLVDAGVTPCGLGARDTLRLEMNYPLYGNDIDHTTNPIEAGLGWVVKPDKGEFVGRDAIVAIKEAGPSRKRIGFEMTERGIARHGYPLLDENSNKIGEVTSGTQSPSLDKAIGVGYVPASLAAPGTALKVDIRGRSKACVVVKTPFYERTG